MGSANPTIAEFFETTRFAGLPAPVVRQAQRSLLDTVGCALAGGRTPVGRGVIGLAASFPQPGGATVLGGPTGVFPILAAMANGFLANALDADDGHRASRLHCGGVVVPTALAAAEVAGCDGKTLLEAIVVGYEIGLRAGIASNSGDIYYGSGHGGAYGAAAAAARILGLGGDRLIDALGIAETHAPTCQLMGWINARKIPMIKEGMGWTAATGLMCAMMADRGISGTLTAFDGKEDFARIPTLGSAFELEQTYFKPYPSCRWSHSPLENLLHLLGTHHLAAADVRRVVVKTFQKAACLDLAAPPTIEDAQYSIPFVLGAALAEGGFGPAQMSEEKLTDPNILAQARKVKVVADPDLERYYPLQIVSCVEVETTGGKVFTRANERIRGDWDLPLTDGELKGKFLAFASRAMPRARAEEVGDRLWRIDETADVRELLASLRAR